MKRRSTFAVAAADMEDEVPNDDDRGYFDDNGAYHSEPLDPAKLPDYSRLRLPAIQAPQPIGAIPPPARAAAQKEILQLLSGRFAWDNFVHRVQHNHHPQDRELNSNSNLVQHSHVRFDEKLFADALVKKREASWQSSVTRCAALSITDATKPADLKAVHEASIARRSVMDQARKEAHRVHLCRQHCASSLRKHVGADAMQMRSTSSMEHSLPPSVPEMSRSRSTEPSSQFDVPARKLLLLNDEMLKMEARSILQQCHHHAASPQEGGLAALRTVATMALHHRSLSPLPQLHVSSQRHPHFAASEQNR